MTVASLSKLKALMIDMDGVLWRGDTAMPGLNAFFDHLRQHQIPFILATNNARKTPNQYVAQLARHKVAISPTEVLTSSIATADYLRQTYPPGSRIYAIGESGIQQAIQEAGFELSDKAAQAVVVGLDMSLSYQKLKTATLLIWAGADYIGTNPDVTYPVEGSFAPGNGAILAAVTAATSQEPVIIGKPKALMFQLGLKRLGTSAEETAMIGDRLETDILGADEVGMKTILVLSGVNSQADVTHSVVKPTWVFEHIGQLTAAWAKTL